MRKLFTLCLLVFSLSASAQWQQTGSKVRYVNGLGIPTRDTAAGVAADSSQILIRPQDSALYVKYKRTWVKVGGGTVSGTPNRVSKFTGATTVGNSSIVDSASAVAMTINPSGNVGIGITNPLVRFHVLVPGNEMRIESTTSSDGFIRYINTSGSMSFGMSGAPTNTMLLYDRTNNHNAYEYLGGASGRHSWYTDNTERMRITSGGDVGIGTASPGYKLDVNGIARVTTEIRSKNTVSNISYFTFEENANTNSATFISGDARTTGSMGLWTNSLERMRITSGGNALIGTTTDNGVDRLQVSGSMNVSARATAENLSVTNNITARTIFAGSDQAGSVDGLVITAGNEKGLVINNTNTTGVASQSRLSWKHNGADRGLFYYSEAGQTFSFQSSGAARNIQIASEAGVGFYMTGANTNVRIGDNTAANAPLSVNGFALINTNTNNSVDALQVNGAIQGNGLRQAYLARTTAYTITNNDYFIDCTSGTFTVTLPASSGRTGRIFVIKNSGTGTITVDGNGAETIDGAATYSLSAQWATVQIMCDGNNWKIISKF